MTSSSNTTKEQRPITPPATPISHAYPSPTSSSSKNTSPSTSSSQRPNLKPSFSTKSTSIRENVQVMVRCRPRSQKELEVDEEPCWLIRPEEGTIELARLKTPNSISTFQYDNVVMGVDNEQVYKAGILDLVRSAMMGYNGTVFAYGQTASGKTYTMMGTEREPGVIPRAVQEVFSYIEEDTNGREYLLRVSYMEIYNEKIKDLLNSENSSPEIVEDKKGVYVRNLKEVIVKTAQEVMNCIKEGEGNRHISATDYNEHSSRSHTIFQLVIESRSKGIPTSTNRGVRVSQLNLIDLAGSEKVATDIERRKEGGYINKSLLTLGNVISKLTSDEPATHIPFRNSKLTRILQAALSGNARISVICTINPTFASKDESLNTLRFAQRAKLVKTAAKMTRILDNSELQKCLVTIAELQTQMQEKNDLEAETRERLKSLLGLILTSSKAEHAEDDESVNLFSRFANISADDLIKESTMRDVVAHCEQGFAAQIAAHQKQMEKMALNLESMQDMMNIMESVHAKQNETLSKRDAQIEKLKKDIQESKQELMQVKSALQISKSTSTGTSNSGLLSGTGGGNSIRATKVPNARATMTPGVKSTKTPMTTTSRLNISGLPSIPSAAQQQQSIMNAAAVAPTPTPHIQIEQEKKQETAAEPSSPTPLPTITTTPAPTMTQQQQETPASAAVIKLDDITPAISLAVQHISEAISTGLKAAATAVPTTSSPTLTQDSDEEEYDMVSAPTTSCLLDESAMTDISQAISSVFQNVLESSLLSSNSSTKLLEDQKEKEKEIIIPKNTITTTLQNVLQNTLASSISMTPPPAVSSTVEKVATSAATGATAEFTPIHEAVLFVQLARDTRHDDMYRKISLLEIKEEVEEEEEEVPVLLTTESSEEDLTTDDKEEDMIDKEQEENEIEEKKELDHSTTAITADKVVHEQQEQQVEQPITTAATTIIETQKEEKAIVYEPYSKSLNQPLIPLPTAIVNRWTIICLAIYIALQTN